MFLTDQEFAELLSHWRCEDVDIHFDKDTRIMTATLADVVINRVHVPNLPFPDAHFFVQDFFRTAVTNVGMSRVTFDGIPQWTPDRVPGDPLDNSPSGNANG